MLSINPPPFPEGEGKGNTGVKWIGKENKISFNENSNKMNYIHTQNQYQTQPVTPCLLLLSELTRTSIDQANDISSAELSADCQTQISSTIRI